MMAAAAADVEIGLELAMEQHLPAARAFVPEIVRHLALGDDGADLRQDEIGEPVHGRAAARVRTPSAQARAPRPSTASTRPGFALPVGIERGRHALDQRRAHHRGIGDARDLRRLRRRADAEADRDRQASNARFRRATAAATLATAADLVPVMPAIAT